MRNCCCCNVKSCCTAVLVILSYFWLFKLYLRDIHPDYRVEQIGLIKNKAFQQSAEDMLLRKVGTPFKMQNFELIEIINQTIPHTLSSEAVLIISSSQTSVQGSYAHLLQKIQQSNLGHNENVGFYVIRKLKGIVLHTPKQIKLYTAEITNFLQYLSNYVMIQKLTIVSFQEGSLLTLRALSMMQYKTFKMINKVLLINAFNPFLVIYHGNAKSFLEQSKTAILNDPIRTKLINNTRIIIINAFDTNLGDKQLNLLFKNSQGEDVTFANTLTVSTRFMWNIYCHLKPQQYFRFQPFLWILTKLFNEDRQSYEQPLNIKQIQNLLLYRQLPGKKQMTVQTRSRLLNNCQTFYLEQYHLSGEVFKSECIRIVRKADIYFNYNTTLLIRSEGRIQVYSQSLERLMPMDTKSQHTIYLFENLPQYRRLHIINRRRKIIHMQISGIHQPTQTLIDKFIHNYGLSELKSFQRRRDDRFTMKFPQPVQLCPGFTLLFPDHFFTQYKLPSPAYSFNVESLEGDCYQGEDYLYGWIRMLSKYWSLGCNLIVFTLLCSHMKRKQVFGRFYYQLVINSCLTFLHTGLFLFTENILVIGIVFLVEQVLNLIVLMSEFINMPRRLSAKIMWPPLIFQILRYYDSQTFPSPWKVLGLQFLAATHRQNVTILFIQFVFIIEYVALDMSNLFHLALICLWLSISGGQQTEPVKDDEDNHPDLIIIRTGKKVRSLKAMLIKLRKQLANVITLCILAMCLSEDGLVIHYIVNFYVIAHVLFTIHGLFDEYIS